MEYRGIPHKNQLPRCPQGALECLGIAWNIMEYHIEINSLCGQGALERLGIAWNIVEYNIKVNSLGACKGLSSAVG